MRQPIRPASARLPGRSFENPDLPLGEELLRRTPEQGAGAPSHLGVADRAKAVGVLRKAEEFMSTDNPAPVDPSSTRRALELAAGRLGLTIDEYDAIVRGDPELVALERQVLEAAVAAHEPADHEPADHLP